MKQLDRNDNARFIATLQTRSPSSGNTPHRVSTQLLWEARRRLQLRGALLQVSTRCGSHGGVCVGCRPRVTDGLTSGAHLCTSLSPSLRSNSPLYLSLLCPFFFRCCTHSHTSSDNHVHVAHLASPATAASLFIILLPRLTPTALSFFSLRFQQTLPSAAPTHLPYTPVEHSSAAQIHWCVCVQTGAAHLVSVLTDCASHSLRSRDRNLRHTQLPHRLAASAGTEGGASVCASTESRTRLTQTTWGPPPPSVS